MVRKFAFLFSSGMGTPIISAYLNMYVHIYTDLRARIKYRNDTGTYENTHKHARLRQTEGAGASRRAGEVRALAKAWTHACVHW